MFTRYKNRKDTTFTSLLGESGTLRLMQRYKTEESLVVFYMDIQKTLNWFQNLSYMFYHPFYSTLFKTLEWESERSLNDDSNSDKERSRECQKPRDIGLWYIPFDVFKEICKLLRYEQKFLLRSTQEFLQDRDERSVYLEICTIGFGINSLMRCFQKMQWRLQNNTNTIRDSVYVFYKKMFRLIRKHNIDVILCLNLSVFWEIDTFFRNSRD